ncbi:MAG: hypothetical protein ACI4VC_01265 [Clostridia bacterium]
MDLIYADENKVDIGVLSRFTFDLAFGKDENDFSLEMELDDHCMKQGYYVYIEDTEYGGIVDTISPDTVNNTVTYSGRTWHGILENKVISPEQGQDYRYFYGECNQVLSEIITLCGLESLFEADIEDTGIEIIQYQCKRYVDAYSCIKDMLHENGMKLRFRFNGTKVVLSSVPYFDYSQDEEFDSSQLGFKIEKNYKVVNHLICLGKGELSDRAVIHLFTDTNGGIQPYSTVDIPVKDEDYILDTSNQVMFGDDEIAIVYDNSNCGATENYVLQTEKPSDWESSFDSYYTVNSSGNYSKIARSNVDVYYLQEEQPWDWSKNYKKYYKKSGNNYVSITSDSSAAYTLLSSKPSDWSINYRKYYTKSGSTYNIVTAKQEESYIKQSKQPKDWNKKYGSYYVYYSDGVTSEYRSVSGISKNRYNVQTMKPTDWETNYNSYYVKKAKGKGYTNVTLAKGNKIPKWQPKRYYTKSTYYVAPKWSEEKIYTRRTSNAAPDWQSNTFYSKSLQTVPNWQTNMYYNKVNELYIPEWKQKTYYTKYIDNYDELVTNGIEKLKSYYESDKINISFDSDKEYDIGDVVGATENVTGISVWQQITKKIVKIDSEISIEYEVG